VIDKQKIRCRHLSFLKSNNIRFFFSDQYAGTLQQPFGPPEFKLQTRKERRDQDGGEFLLGSSGIISLEKIAFAFFKSITVFALLRRYAETV
jgi:hypothetical protein